MAGECSPHDKQMQDGISGFIEFLKSKDSALVSTVLGSYKCKVDERLTSKEHRKDAYEIRKTSEHVIQVQFFTDANGFTCFIKFYVKLL